MSDLMIRELGCNSHTKIGNAVVLPAASSGSLCYWPEDGDVDGHFELFTSPALKQKGGRGYGGRHDSVRRWQEAVERLNEWSRNLREAFSAVGPGLLERVREQAVSGTRSLAHRLREARDSARGRVTDWQTAVVQRVAGWRDLALDRRQMWLVLLGERWAEWLGDVRLRWMIWRSVLLERLAGCMRASSLALGPYWRYLLGLLRAACSWLAEGLAGLRAPLGACLFRDRRYGARVVGASLRSFGLARAEDLARLCQDFCRCDKDCHLVDDLEFLCTEPQMKALVAALLFALFMLGEVLAASWLPVWCASPAAPGLTMQQMMASATLSPSVLASLNGAAGVV